jgi:excisionase family DNA binding protein
MTEALIDLGCRITLRPAEAAKALGVSERTLRTMLPHLPHFREGGVVLIPVESLRRWADDRAEREKSRVERLADEIRRSFE